MYIVIIDPDSTEPLIDANSHGFIRRYTSIEEAKAECASFGIVDYKIFEEVQ